MKKLFFVGLVIVLAGPSVFGAESEVRFAGHGGFELVGTLSLPVLPEGKKAPGVLLLSGSGPPDRNGNVPPFLVTDLLKQVAERLENEGFAVLRYDKRSGAGYNSKWPKDLAEISHFFAWESFVGDARAGLATLRARPEVDPSRVAVLGHSEGGLIALSLGAEAENPPAVLVLAGTAARRLDDILRFQIDQNLRLAGTDEVMLKEHMAALEAGFKTVVEEGKVPENLPAALKPIFPPTALRLLKSYFTVEPTQLAAKFSGPVLVLHGELDSQVPWEENTGLMMRVLDSRPNGVEEKVVVARTSHNFKRVEKTTDFGFGGPVVPEALEGLVGFLVRTLKP